MKRSTTITYSIGELSRRTGLSVLRIRAWETRHGVPRSTRMESGHRRYSAAEALHLDLLAQAVRAGGRIGDLSGLDLETLALRVPGATGKPEVPDIGGRWFECVLEGDESALRSDMDRLWDLWGWREFVEHHAIPFLTGIGGAWEAGDIGIAHEHFGSGVLQSFLEEKWRSRNLSNRGDPLLLSMLPGDAHGIGLHLCALAAVEAGVRVLWLGPNTPVATLLSAIGIWRAAGVCLSLSYGTDWNDAKPFLKNLRTEFDLSIPFYAGGAGMRRTVKGIHSFKTIGEFHDHLESDR